MTKKTLFSIIFSLSVAASYAELNMSANLQTNHLWRGGEVADGLVVTYDASVTPCKSNLTVGVWGATNGQGTYKEFNYYAEYNKGGFTASLWDIYNFSEYATYNNEEFFNYNGASTGRFLDATVAYRFDGAFPIKLSWSTVLFGRDRNSENSANRYSTFCYAEYPIYDKESWRVDAGVGGVFALKPQGESANFYGDRAGIAHISLAVKHDVVINKYHIPITMTALWNPISNNSYLQLAAQLFSF